MYNTFFGLRESPFNINPDPRFLFLTSRTQEALDQLTYGIQNRKGCVLLTGEVGTGKTTLVHYLLDWLRREKMPTAFIFNSHLSVNHLFDFILSDFGVPTDFRLRGNMLLHLTKWLLECFRAGRAPVLILDEAQGLSFELLEEIRLLLNLETSTEKLLQIVLVGQPELEVKLKRPELRQFRQRIALRCSTAALTLEECCGYISDRLRIAGAAGEPVFTSRAVESLHFYSRGIPRVINILCEHALINAYAKQLNPVPVEMVEEAARDFLWEESRPVTASHNCGSRGSSKLAVMQSALTGELVKSLDIEEPTSRQRIWAMEPDAHCEFVENVTGTNCPATAVPEHQEIPVFEEESQNESIPCDNLASRMLVVETDERERGLRAEPLESSVDPVAGLVADMKRLLAAVSPSSSLRVVPARNETRESKAAATTSAAAPAKTEPRIGRMARIPRTSVGATIYAILMLWKSQSAHLATGLSSFLSSAGQSQGPLADLQRIRKRATSIQSLLGRWAFEFKRDWAEMINSMQLREVERSFRYWLRQPLGPNHWGQTKASPLGGRRNIHR